MSEPASILRHRSGQPHAALLALLFALLLTACINDEAESDNSPESPSPQASQQAPTPGGTPTEALALPSATAFIRTTSSANPTAPDIPAAVQAALRQAALDFEVTEERISVVSFEPAVWPTTALGCPELGRSYAQIVTSGLEIVLNVAGTGVIYHVDDNAAAVINCGTLLAPLP